MLQHEELTEKIIGIFYDVFNELGHGFAESVYENAMAVALDQAGIPAEFQVPIRVHFRGICVGDFRADAVVADCVILELKAVKKLDSAHEAQVLNYLRATEIEVALLMNFGDKPESTRFAYSNERKRLRSAADQRG